MKWEGGRFLYFWRRDGQRGRESVSIFGLSTSPLCWDRYFFHQAFDSEKRSPVSMLACLFACARAYIKGRPFSLFFWCDRKTASLDHAVVIRHTLTYCLRRGATQHQERERDSCIQCSCWYCIFLFLTRADVRYLSPCASLEFSLSHIILVMLVFFFVWHRVFFFWVRKNEGWCTASSALCLYWFIPVHIGMVGDIIVVIANVYNFLNSSPFAEILRYWLCRLWLQGFVQEVGELWGNASIFRRREKLHVHQQYTRNRRIVARGRGAEKKEGERGVEFDSPPPLLLLFPLSFSSHECRSQHSAEVAVDF